MVIEVLGIDIGVFPSLLLDECLGLRRGVGGVEELVDRAEVNGQREHFTVVRGVDAVHVIGECGEAVHIIPDALAGRVEQMGAVLVDFRSGLFIEIGIRVATNMVAHIDDMHTRRRIVLNDLLRDGQAEQASSDNDKIRIRNIACLR